MESGGNMSVPEFDRRYPTAYPTALKSRPITLSCIDAFAGAGVYRDSDHEYAEFEVFHEDSATIA